MKKLYFLITSMLVLAAASAQTQYEVIKEGDTKILKGIISKDLISKDSSFTWYKQNQQGFTANSQAVASLKAKGSDIEFIVFGGTWCDDTRVLLPKYFSWLEASGFPQEKVTLIGVDRNK